MQVSYSLATALRAAALAATMTAAMWPAHAAPDGPGHKPPPVRVDRHHTPKQWHDAAHGHRRHYPVVGWSVTVVPRHAHRVVWGGARYHFHEGVWYHHAPHGYVVVRPPVGVWVPVLPVFRTVVTIGALTYYYANGVYYRERGEGGYEVVTVPAGAASDGVGGVSSMPTPIAPIEADERLYIYPRQGQSAQQQSRDEYECHRWAVGQTGFDPTAAATGQASPDSPRRADYRRARVACLEGRGYTVK